MSHLCIVAECGCKSPLPEGHEATQSCHPGVADLEALQARWDRVRELRDLVDETGRHTMTLAQIGLALDPPVSRQRVSQMLNDPRPTSPGGARQTS